MARLGVFGGTFDPPHIGHLIVAADAYCQLNLDRLLWVLTPDPPHKQKLALTPLQHRLDMLHVSIRDNPSFELCTVDIDRPGPHYAVDTMKILKAQQPDVDWIYIIGGDSLRDLPTWHHPHELLKTIHELGVVLRPDVQIDLPGIEAKIHGLTIKVKIVNSPLIGISATHIRQRIEDGQMFRYLVPPEVYEIICERGLYRVND